MGIKELELFTIKIGYSLLVISSNYSFGWGPLRWRAAHLPCRRATSGEMLCRYLLCRGRGLFCEAYGAGFADYGYLYLARVNHLVLNLLCYICRELLGLFV